MRLAAIAMMMLFLTAETAASAKRPPEQIQFPVYDSVKGLKRYASPRTYAGAVNDKHFKMERVFYQSDGLEVSAYIYRSVGPRRRAPVVIFNRGSWTWPSFAAELLPMAHRLALKGYIVIAPMYRGSGGALGTDELGGNDLNDLFNLLPAIRNLSYVDANQLYLYGESRGGMMVYQALRDAFPARAAAVYGGFTDLDAMLQEPEWATAGQAIWPTLATDRASIVARRSALKWPDKINTPILIMHGAKDKSVNPAQALQLASELNRLGKRYELEIVDGEGHVLTGRAEERDTHAAEWFARHTPASPRH